MELNVMRGSMNYFGTNTNSKQLINILARGISRKENNTAQLIVKLECISCTLHYTVNKSNEIFENCKVTFKGIIYGINW